MPAADQIPASSPPSTYAIADLIDQKPGSLGRVAALTFQRALWIGIGLYLAGIRGQKLKQAAFVASATLTTVIAAGFIRKGRRQ